MKKIISILVICLYAMPVFSQSMIITEKNGGQEIFQLSDIESITFDTQTTENLVACYPFNGSAIDETGNGHDGTVYGAVLTADRFDRADRAFLFNGDDNYIDIGNNIDAGPNFSISLWCKPIADAGDDAGMYRYLFLHRGDYRDILIEYGKRSGTDRKIMFMAFDENGQEGFYFYSNAVLELNEWHHIVATYDGQTKRLYINGNLDNEASWGKPVTWTENVFGNFIGRNAYDPNYKSFPGSIDDLCIYNRVLDAAEIAELYHANGWDE
ncbi:LamG domain-containing protein [candidate division KSB1 bacterium]|nr:LamG domain-containing protein [candidate division KSB1 bacterium]